MKKLPIGLADFKKLIEENYAYIDKTLLIQEIIERGTELALIPRPRRFGKTVNMSMLKYFFEKTQEDHSHLFSNFKIWKTPYKDLQGQYPVIFFTLKEVKQETWEMAYEKIKFLIADEFERHRYLLNSQHLSKEEKQLFLTILKREASQVTSEISLKRLIFWLSKHHDKRVIVLIDEYDAPIHMAYFHGYYSQIINFMRNWLGGGLKDNLHLERSVITGILRIAKENIFSDLNHSSNFTLFSQDFGDKFGLLEEEVLPLLIEYGLGDQIETVRKWYNGYHIGSFDIYNPWSILKYIQHKEYSPYWVNTSGNELVKEQLTQKGIFLKEDFEMLLLGNSISKIVDEGLVFEDLKISKEAVWGLLFFSGYLTCQEPPARVGTRFSCQLAIPNQEIQALFQDMIQDYFSNQFHESWTNLIKNLLNGNIEAFSEEFKELIMEMFSVHDVPKTASEQVYHAFVLGLFASIRESYEIKSNRESGLGRYDICLFPKNLKHLGFILEFKKAQNDEDLDKLAKTALDQIEDLSYITDLKARKVSTVLAIGIAFQGKKVSIKHKFLLRSPL